MISPVSKTINGREYTITPWPAMDAVEKFGWILKVASPLISGLPQLFQILRLPEDERMESWADTMSGFTISLATLDPKLLREVAKVMLVGIFSKEGDCKINPDSYFNDYPEDMLPLIVAAFVVQFLPFTKGIDHISFSQEKAGSKSRKA